MEVSPGTAAPVSLVETTFSALHSSNLDSSGISTTRVPLGPAHLTLKEKYLM